MSEGTLMAHGGNRRQLAERGGIFPESLLDFSANINPLGPPESVLIRLRQQLHTVAYYPDPEAVAPRAALAAAFGLDPGELLLGNGATELIYLVVRAVQPRRVLVAEPGFADYRRAAEVNGAQVVALPLMADRGFQWSLEEIIRAARAVDLIFLGHPHNPTGTLVPPAILDPLARWCRDQGIQLVVDESFLPFVPSWRGWSSLAVTPPGPHLSVIWSLTKIFALPGLRVGCGWFPPGLLARIQAVREPWSVNCLAQEAVLAALEANGYLERSQRLIRGERQYLAEQLRTLPATTVFEGAVNFLLVRVQQGEELIKGMLQRGIALRDCCSFAGLGPDFVRLAVLRRDENRRLLREWRDLQDWKGANHG